VPINDYLTSPQVDKIPFSNNEKEAKIDEKSQNSNDFSCVKCDFLVK
jgi:hypothetical protein